MNKAVKIESLEITEPSPSAAVSPDRTRNRDVLAVLGLLTIFVLYFYPVLFDGKSVFYRDILNFAYPFKHFQLKSWSEGVLPFWHPGIFSGVPVLELMHTGVFYPLNTILFLGDFSFAFNLYILLHHFILMFSVYGLTRYWGLSVPAAVCSAVTALMGGYFLSLSSLYNHFQSAIWFPLILLFFQKYLEGGRIRHFLAMVVFLGLQILGGGPENCILSTGLLYLYALFMVPSDSKISGLGPRTLVLAGAVGFGLGLCTFQLLPTYEVMKNAVRSDGLSFLSSTLWSVSPGSLANFIFPVNFVRFMERTDVSTNFFIQSFYMGLIPLAFMFAGLFYLLRKRAVQFWTAVFLWGVFFAMGKHNPAYPYFFDWVPLFNKFRYPEKFLFLSSFALVFLVGFGVQAFEDMAAKGKRGSKYTIFFMLGLCAGVYGISLLFSREGLMEAMAILLPFSLVSILLTMVKLKPGMFQGLILLLLLADLTMKNLALIPFIDRKFYDDPPEQAEKLPRQTAPYRVYSGPLASDKNVSTKNRFPPGRNLLFSMTKTKDRLYPNLATIYGIDFVDGLTGFDLKDKRLWSKVFINSPEEKRRRMLKRANVKYWVTPKYEIQPNRNRPFGLMEVRQFDDALPRAFLVPKARQGKGIYTINDYFDEKFDPTAEVLLEEAVSSNAREDFQGEVEDIHYVPNGVTIKTRQNGDGFLVLLDSYFPGWTVQVDGVSKRVYRANFFFRAVQLGPGAHTLEFTFEPVGFKTGLWVSLFTFVVLTLAISIPGARKRIFPV